LHIRGDAESTGVAPVAEEVPVAFVFNGRSRAVMMATPADLEDFAIGLALAEGVVEDAAAIRHLQVVRYGQGIELQLTVPPEAEARLAARGLEGRGGCGVCGIESIREVLRPVRRIERRPAVEREALWRAEAALHDRQSYHQATGAVHAAGWATPDGTLHVVREDVGRHNALDKVIGALARADTDPRDGFLIVTSRASFEMVQKATTVGVGLLAAVSRPTGLAIRLAEAAGLTLVGVLRGRTASYYT
jgi:FdhD protein